MKILIIGASGFLGTKLNDILGKKHGIAGTAAPEEKTEFAPLDIRDKNKVRDYIREVRPEVVVHTAAMKDPDICEQKKEEAEAINHLGARNVVEGCREGGAKLIYISTDYVFDGKKGNYKEVDPCNPINHYGWTKLKAEEDVSTLENGIIFRFDLLYGYNGKNKNNGLFSQIVSGKKIEMNFDQKRQPLLIDDVASAIEDLLEKKEKGIFHLAGPDNISKYELGLALEKIVRQDSLLVPIAEKEQIARRPKNASIDVSKALSKGLKFHSIEEGVAMIAGDYGSS